MAVTAAAVQSLRKKTGLPLMECKRALTECDGDEDAAVQWLRERGAQVLAKRADRETSFGRFGIYASVEGPAGAIVELKCESAPVTQNEEFIQLANDLAQQLALGPGAATADELLSQPSPSQDGVTLTEQKDDLFNRVREVFNVGRMHRYEGGCGAYSHNSGTVSGVLLSVEGGDDTLAKDICMHVAAMRPKALTVDELSEDDVATERKVLREAALKEGKPENIVDKMVDGRMRNYFAETVLTEQAFVKDDKTTVGKTAENGGMTIKGFTHWELGAE
ncbi:MAG: translation elongation factor Ts [Pirellulaceae bacterium]|jgi:elongation factor Ts|nr:translation elongation factor Ts [Pirellulaceae bacterium]MDP7014253.1 translation elongation factor Ts [Pirellulaceae bacterium]